ncbi:MAG: RNA polymerase subunit sigma-70 [Clostridia bacterium]
MTQIEKDRIRILRMGGISYARIATELSLPEGTVKTYCNRSGIKKADASICQFCGRPVEQMPGRKQKRFCSDKCRLTWWNQNRDKPVRCSSAKKQCPVCGTEFECYGAARKYCCHACYIQDRFGKARFEHDQRTA